MTFDGDPTNPDHAPAADLIDALRRQDDRLVLFHGTGEPIEGPLRGGGYDGLLWTAREAAIAQQYIPRSGIVAILTAPDRFTLDRHVKPGLHSIEYRIACSLFGGKLEGVEYDRFGTAVSWPIPDGWPTYRDVYDHIENDLGYTPRGGIFNLSTSLDGSEETIHPADWLRPGHLFATLADHLSFRDLRRGDEGDLTDLEYHDHRAFAQAEADGYDGVIINDFAQTDLGNYGHVSYGINATGLAKLTFVRTEATHLPLEGGALPRSTPALEALMDAFPDQTVAMRV